MEGFEAGFNRTPCYILRTRRLPGRRMGWGGGGRGDGVERGSSGTHADADAPVQVRGEDAGGRQARGRKWVDPPSTLEEPP